MFLFWLALGFIFVFRIHWTSSKKRKHKLLKVGVAFDDLVEREPDAWDSVALHVEERLGLFGEEESLIGVVVMGGGRNREG